MRRKIWLTAVVSASFVGALPGAAEAQVLGSVTPPAGSSPQACEASDILVQVAGSAYAAPAGGWITQWQTNTTDDHAGDPITLVVLRPSGGPSHTFTIEATDQQTLPAALPSSNVATFTPPAPIAVAAGDVFGLEAPASSDCLYSGGATPIEDVIGDYGDPNPMPGQSVSNPSFKTGADALDLAATFVPTSEDAGVTTVAGPPNATSGYPAVLSSTVTNSGLLSLPLTFTDYVPAGLKIDSAVAGSGTCATPTTQTVTCTLNLTRGGSAPVQIVVTPSANGSYQNDVTVAPPPGVPDFNPANDSATSVLLVLPQAPAPPPPHCVVPRLRGIPAWFAQRVLGLLGCQAGLVTHVHSRTVPKGRVVGTAPGAGTYPVLKVVSVQVSSGPAPRRRHPRHRAHGAQVGVRGAPYFGHGAPVRRR
jgi:hypothetical protein